LEQTASVESKHPLRTESVHFLRLSWKVGLLVRVRRNCTSVVLQGNIAYHIDELRMMPTELRGSIACHNTELRLERHSCQTRDVELD